MNKNKASTISFLIFETCKALMANERSDQLRLVNRLTDELEGIASEPEPTLANGSPYHFTKDDQVVLVGKTVALYRVLLTEGNTLRVTGILDRDGWLNVNKNGMGTRHAITHLYASHLAAWNAHKEYRANGGIWHQMGNAERVINTEPTFQTKDAQVVKAGSIQTLWAVLTLTSEITRFTGRVDMKGNLFEIVGSEGEDIAPTFPINELYFWRVNLLKDELAAQSTSTAVEVEYTDNAEMELEQTSEYD